VVRLNNRRVLTDPMLSRAGAMDPVPDAADGRRIPLVDLPLDDEGLQSLIRGLDAVLVTHLHRTLSEINKLGMRAGVSLNPSTPVCLIEPALNYADLVLVNPAMPWTVKKDNILYHCKWSPFEGTNFKSRVTHTLVNGQLVYQNGKVNEIQAGKRLLFER
jgi:hypothetical protein